MTVLAFLLAVFPVIATPGVSFTLMTQRVATDGWLCLWTVVVV